MAEHLLFVQFNHQLNKYMLPIDKEKEITIGNRITDTITIEGIDDPLHVMWDGSLCYIQGQELNINERKSITVNDEQIQVYLIGEQYNNGIVYDLTLSDYITFGTHDHDDIVFLSPQSTVNAILFRGNEQKPHMLQVHSGDVYHNYQKVTGTVHIESGDHLFLDGMFLTVRDGAMSLIAPTTWYSTTLIPLEKDHTYYSETYPEYHRSPRIIYREPDEKKVIAKPSSKPSKPSEQLMRMIIPPLVMIGAFTLVSIFQPRGIYIVVMLAMTVTTVIISLVTYVKNVRKYRRDLKERDRRYKQYLLNKTKELYNTVEEQRHALEYHYPDVEEIEQMARKVDARTFEKTMFHHDFLQYRVGLGDRPISFELDFNEEEYSQEDDDLIDLARELYTQHKEIKHVPITTSLTNCPVGYIGQRSLVLEQLEQLVMQLAFFHSYHELQFVTIFPEHEKEQWNWMRWLPHATLQNHNVRGFVYHERSRDQVLNSLYQILQERQNTLDEKGDSKDKTYFSPHYVVLITDEKIILDHTIMEFLNEDCTDLGVSLVFVQDVLESLPEHVQTIIDICDRNSGNVLLEESELVNQAFAPDQYSASFNKENIARALASLDHVQNLKSSIPEAVTFLEMFGVEQVEELTPVQRWRENETYKSLAVPLGLRGKDDIVYLNLHEKAHGPHGLVAGTTGSGKSEIIQSYILSLAVYFHPHEVAFLLIDYKGGGMANLFKDLPHALGAITNLDGAQSMRALASIKAELKKRQRLFGEFDVNHINQYQKLVKQGEATEPMPHLFLISDEFAELKAEQPDFMKELVSTARIGRSLGIHLILATQKPTGVVDDQIWSNSKFKLALKVQDKGDSNEILKTPDAAEITLPGRAYLQVGNNEIYELFQSAWSGAEYRSATDEENVIDTTIYAINDLGQYDILTEDLSGLDDVEEVKKTLTELEATIEYIAAVTEEENIEQLPSPWLPPLEERIYITDIKDRSFKEEWETKKEPLHPIIGMGDFPDEQDQRPISLPLTKDGHFAIFSSPGYGKSTFIQTVIMDLARTHRPDHLHVYLLDFGTNGLLPLRDLPHVADTILIDEEEKVEKLVRLLESESRKRKKLLSKYGVATLDMYEKASGETLPHIVLAIDNYDAVREADFVEPFERAITQLAREGGSIGIHLVITGSRQNVLRLPLLSNIKTQISLYLIDDLETRGIVGRTSLETEEIYGRGLVKLEEPVAFQTALPVKGEDTLRVIEGIQQEAKAMSAFWDGDIPEPIPMMPEGVIPFEDFAQSKGTKKVIEQGLFPLGLEFENVTTLAFDLNAYGHLVAVGDRLDRVESLQMTLGKNMTLMKEFYKTMILDTTNNRFATIGKDVEGYISKQEQMPGIKNDLVAEVNDRIKENVTEPKWLIYIPDFKEFTQQSMLTDDDIRVLMRGSTVGMHFIFSGEYSYIGQSFEQIPKYIRGQSVAGVVAMRLGDQDLYKQRFIANEPSLAAYECYYAMDHQFEKIKIPK